MQRTKEPEELMGYGYGESSDGPLGWLQYVVCVACLCVPFVLAALYAASKVQCGLVIKWSVVSVSVGCLIACVAYLYEMRMLQRTWATRDMSQDIDDE